MNAHERKSNQITALIENRRIRRDYAFELFVTGKKTPIHRRRSWWRAVMAMF